MTRPEDLAEFRTRVAALFMLAGAPALIVAEIGDLGSMAGETAKQVYSAWRDLEAGFPPEDWTHAAPSVLHDLALDLGLPLEIARRVEALTERAL